MIYAESREIDRDHASGYAAFLRGEPFDRSAPGPWRRGWRDAKRDGPSLLDAAERQAAEVIRQRMMRGGRR